VLSPTRVLRLAVPAAGIAVLAGCAAPAGSAESDRISIVASTSVYGAIAAQLAGDAADVTSIIAQANQDPHGYEATARDQLTLSRADLVIQNGGGYDPFVAELLETTGTDPVLLTAVEDGEAAAHHSEAAEHEHDHDHAENEHVWYSLHAMEELAGRIGDALADLHPEHADDFATNSDQFAAGIEELEQRIEGLHAESEGLTALATEPVPLPLLAELGIEDRTPEELLAAIEDERDVPPAVLAEALDAVTSGTVDLVAFNEQTVDATSTRLLDQAEASGVPVVSFSELPPEGTGYLEWMDGNLDRIEQALR
jgi:zinc/manganese transport system substrate-binding protein